MTYLEARRIEREFKRYRQLALDYWAAIEPIDYGGHGWMAGPNPPTHRDTDQSRPIRQELTMLGPSVEEWALRLGVSVTGKSFPAPAIGGPVIPFNLLACVVDNDVGHSRVPREQVLDAIDKCIGAANAEKRRLGGRLLKPWCWLVDVPALIVGWPFAVMRKAGVPHKIVEGTGAQVLKGLMTVAIWIAGFAYAILKTGLAGAIGAALP